MLESLKISVVVPVFNVEDYLVKCLDSLAGQTYSNYEVICVNDGSTDNSLAILNEFAVDKHYFKIADQANAGLSAARNAGIKLASGDIVCFVDSDDWLENNALEVIALNFDRGDIDILTYGANCVPSVNNEWLEKHLSPRNAFYDNFSIDVMFKEMSRPFAWRTACRLQFIKDNKLYFDESLKFGEDQVWDFAIYPLASGIKFISDKIYSYRTDRPGSLMDGNARILSTKAFAHLKIADSILKRWSVYGILTTYTKSMLEFVVDFCLYEFLLIDREFFYKLLEHLKLILLKYWSEDELLNTPISKSSRALLELCFAEPTLTDSELKMLKFRYKLDHEGLKGTFKSLFKRL